MFVVRSSPFPMNVSCFVFINKKLPLAKGNKHLCHFEKISHLARVGKAVSHIAYSIGCPSSHLLMDDQLHLTACNRIISISFKKTVKQPQTNKNRNPQNHPTVWGFFHWVERRAAANCLFCRNPLWLERNYSCSYTIHVEFSICHSFPLPPPLCPPARLASAESLHWLICFRKSPNV